jgi:hypothetical protein
MVKKADGRDDDVHCSAGFQWKAGAGLKVILPKTVTVWNTNIIYRKCTFINGKSITYMD